MGAEGLEPRRCRRRHRLPNDGEKIGKVGQVFLDDQTGRPEFATVRTGLFGSNESFVPLADATLDNGRLTVPFTKDKAKDAPNVDLDGDHLDEDEERRLYAHYGLSYSGTGVDSGRRDADSSEVGADTSSSGLGHDRTTGYDTSGPTTDQAMTRSEEHLTAGTRTEEAGRARLRKYVVTEEETVTVPVRKEHIEVEDDVDERSWSGWARPRGRAARRPGPTGSCCCASSAPG